MEYVTETYRLTQDESTGLIEVWPVQPNRLRKVAVQGNKLTEQPLDQADLQLQRESNKRPFFAANWAGKGLFNVDMDCGMQRLSIAKTTAQVRHALTVCGFSKAQIWEIMRVSKVVVHDSIHSYC
jgi:hypothetical protein